MSQDNPPAVPPLPPGVLTWEYFTHSINLSGFFTSGNVTPQAVTDALNWYGAQGWELVSAFDTNRPDGGSQTLLLIFKRCCSPA